MLSPERACPKCGGPMYRDGVDIGVGAQPFPWVECACGHRIDDEPTGLIDFDEIFDGPLDDDF